ncbi:MAG: hypothetical protein PHY48_13310 [Candidatus Cloacimonetes bacterium]|nr:hypothetical protein [Candidatus Cloacimonadota bacterium]
MGINELSDAAFSIRNSLKLVNANGVGFITNQSLFTIRWKLQDIASSSSIFWEYSADNWSWTRINSSSVAVSDESMMWFVDTGLANTMWLRAVEQGSNRIVGKSE